MKSLDDQPTRDHVAAVVRFGAAPPSARDAAARVVAATVNPWGEVRIDARELDRAWRIARRVVRYAAKFGRSRSKNAFANLRGSINEVLPAAVPGAVSYRLDERGRLRSSFRGVKPGFADAVAIGLAALVDEEKRLYRHVRPCAHCGKIFLAIERRRDETPLRLTEERKRDWERRWSKVRYVDKPLGRVGVEFDRSEPRAPKRGSGGGHPHPDCSWECREARRNRC